MQNLLILGCGYVGSALAQRWKSDPSLRITATTTSRDRLPLLHTLADRGILLRGDDAAALRTALSEIDGLLLTLGAKRGTPYAETYLKTAQTLAQVLSEETAAPRLRQIIYTGSYAVYGDQKNSWVTEATPPNPVNDNSKVLLRTEQTLLGLQTTRRNVCVLRLGGIYGPGRELAKIFQFAAGKTRPGDGSAPGNWVHLEDIVGAIAFVQARNLNGLYNLVDSNPLPRKVLLDWVCSQANLAPIRWDPSQTDPRPYSARVSNQKLRDAGYQFRHPSIIPQSIP